MGETHPVRPSAPTALSAACGCMSSFCQQLAQSGVPGCHLPELLQLQEGLHMLAHLSIHLLPVGLNT